MSETMKILMLEHSPTDAELVHRLLKKEIPHFEFSLAINKETFLLALNQFHPDIILADNSLPQFNATEALQIVNQRSLHIPFIMVTGTVSEELAVGIIKSGADDYILKDRLNRLPAAIDAAVQKKKSERTIKHSEEIRKLIMNSALDAIICINTTGAITVWNPQAEKMFGWKEEEIIGKQLDETIIPEKYRQRHKKGFIHYLKTAEGPLLNKVIEISALNQAGNEFPIELAIVSIKQNEEEFFCAFIRDITDRKKAEKELQTVHERLSFHLENTPLGFIEWDTQNMVISGSKRAAEIFGWNEKEFISQKRDGLMQVYEEDLPWVSKMSEQLKSGELERNSVQHRNYTKDGKVIWCEWFNSVLRDEKGEVISIMSLVQDITERKEDEENIRQSEIRLKAAQSIAHISAWEIDFIKNVQTWSDELYRIYGINKAEVEPSTELFLSFMHPDDANFAQKKVQEAFDTFKNSSFDFRFIRKDGKIRHGYSEWNFEFDKNEKPLRLYGIVQDITERKEQEEERLRLSSILETTSDFVAIADIDQRPLYLNKAGREMTGYDEKEDLSQKFIHDFMPQWAYKIVLQEGIPTDMREGKWKGEIAILTKNGSEIPVSAVIIVHKTPGGKPQYVSITARDISERQRREEERLANKINQQKEITRAMLQAQEMERNKLGRELHDNINQILAAVNMKLGYCLDNYENGVSIVEGCRVNVQQAIEEARNLSHRMVMPRFAESSLQDELEFLTKQYSNKHKIQLDVARVDEKVIPAAIKETLFRIVQEQLSNIQKHANAKEIVVQLASDRGWVIMLIKDNGIGFDMHQKRKGIGITNILNRVDAYDGIAEIHSAPGQGASLSVKIPLAK